MSRAATLADSPPLLTYLLRLGDDNLVLAQRLGELIAAMPDLEEDIAVANMALDHLGQARLFYEYAVDLDPAGRSEDDLAMLRSEREFLNAVLVEQPNGDFGQTMVRQLLVDAFQVPLYTALATSSDDRLAGIGATAAKEARYHLERSAGWVVTLGNGTEESHRRTQAGLDAMWQFSADLFASDDVEADLAASGVAPDLDPLRAEFDSTVGQVLTQAGLTVPADPYQRTGGRTGFHTSELGHLLPELQWLYRAHPGVEW